MEPIQFLILELTLMALGFFILWAMVSVTNEIKEHIEYFIKKMSNNNQ